MSQNNPKHTTKKDCHYWRNSRGVRKKAERQVISSYKCTNEEVDKVLCKFKAYSITKSNELFYPGAVVVINRLGVKNNKAAERKEPMWRRRLQNKIKQLRKDLCKVESSNDKEVNYVRHWQLLKRNYSIWVKTLGVVINKLKQKRYEVGGIKKRVDRFRQNRMFQNIQG